MKKTKRPSPEERRAALENPEFVYVNINHVFTRSSEPKTGEMLEGGFVLDWGAKKIGFGQIRFWQKGKDVRKLRIECESECMGTEFVRKALLHFAKTAKILE